MCFGHHTITALIHNTRQSLYTLYLAFFSCDGVKKSEADSLYFKESRMIEDLTLIVAPRSPECLGVMP